MIGSRYRSVAAACAGLAMLFVGYLTLTAHPTHGAASLASPHLLLTYKDDVGSAVHIGDGFALTAAHLIPQRDQDVTLTPDGAPVRSGEVLWKNTTYDVALLRMAKFSDVASADVDCSPLSVGKPVTLHGNPMGWEFISSIGHVTGAPRTVEDWKNVAIVDSTIVPGLSGGGVMNDAGDLVGITVGAMIYNMGVTGFGFIVPAETICTLLARS